MSIEPYSGQQWFLAGGEPYRGGVFEDDKGKPFGETTTTCERCNGSGKWRRGRRFGTCKGCDGAKEVFDQVRLYTAAQIATKERAREKRNAARDEVGREREAARVARWGLYLINNADLVERARAAGDTFINGVFAKAENYGSLTPAQERAVENHLAQIKADLAAYGHSKPLAEPGTRVEVEVTCRGVGTFMGKGYGRNRGSREVWITEMLDDDGNALVAVSDAFRLEPGDRALLRGTVMEHDTTRRAWARTRLGRVVVLGHTPAEPENAMLTTEGFETAIPF